MWTNSKIWKVKRIRRNPAVTLQISDGRGRPKSEEKFAGKTEVLDAARTQRVRDLVSRKYGIIGTVLIRLHTLFKGADGSVGLAITRV
ncbi:hypothetical protein ACW2Q0_16485 [Nocardia sp. R16R-3T]